MGPGERNLGGWAKYSRPRKAVAIHRRVDRRTCRRYPKCRTERSCLRKMPEPRASSTFRYNGSSNWARYEDSGQAPVEGLIRALAEQIEIQFPSGDKALKSTTVA